MPDSDPITDDDYTWQHDDPDFVADDIDTPIPYRLGNDVTL